MLGGRYARWLLFLVLCRVYGAQSYSFLLTPVPVGSSHCLEMMGIGRALHERGHTVYLLMPDFAEVDKCVPKDLEGAIKVKTFPTELQVAKMITSSVKEGTEVMASGKGGHLHLSKYIHTIIPAICAMYAGARPILDQFNTEDSNRLDMVVIEGVSICGCLSLLPAYLQRPFAVTNSFINPYDSNMPWPVTSYPFIWSDLPGKMSFGQRVVNTVWYGMIQGFVKVLERQYTQGDDFGAALSNFDYGAAMKKADLYLENSDHILDHPKATYPNFVQVGGLTTLPARPLPAELQKYFDACTQGVVVVSLGSMLYHTSQAMTDKLLTAMAKVKMNVVLRLDVTKATVKVADHVKVVAWFPQNDALGHVNTRLFVSHCGKNGFFEGLYHGVPILCMPLNGDGFGTSKRVTEFGVGGSVDLKAATAEELGDAIKSILEDSQVRHSMKVYSTLFHDRPETAGHRAATALEHVIKYGGDHLRPHTVELNFLQYTGLDVFFVLVVGTMVLIGLGVYVSSLVFRRVLVFLMRKGDRVTEKGNKQN